MSVDQFKGELAYINTFRRGLSRFFREHDVLICPVFPDIAIGIQIVGPNWKEDRILALAKVLESKLAGWRRAIPDVLTADFEDGVRVSRA